LDEVELFSWSYFTKYQFRASWQKKNEKKAFGYLIDAFNAKMSIWETYSFFSDETEPTL
jgi:hypothetical protein